MSNPVKNKGLCTNCNHASYCTLTGDSEHPVLECEEHECFEPEEILEIVSERDDRMGGVISILDALQSKYGYLPGKALRAVADETGRSLVDIYGVATFYKSFSLRPRGRHLISVCLGTACHVRGAPAVVEEFQTRLGIHPGETTPDREFTLETVNCLGACALGPIVVVDGHYFSQVRKNRVQEILERTREGLSKIDVKTDQRLFPVELHCPRCNHSLMDDTNRVDDLPGVRVTVSFADKHGWLCLSSLYGSYSIESEFEVPENTVVHFFCPHCHAELDGSSVCVDCGAPLIPLIALGGGMVQICSRRGCRGHLLDV
ncbi:MAG: NADH-quinone oxidoreductase subunit NuoE family protein [Planctomycetota bacterium]